MLPLLRDTIARHAMLTPGDRVCVAWSGGADSTALVHGLLALRDELGISLSAAHVHHGLHPAADDHSAVVAAAARSLGLEFHLRRADLAGQDRWSGESIEQAGRRVRLEFFRELLGSGAATKVATGHTIGDQAETVLLRLLRGAGPRGLAAIRPVLDGQIVRPLLAVSRADILRFLDERKVTFVEDPTNASPEFDRNRLRQRLMPVLEQDWNPRITERLAALAGFCQQDEDYWEAEMRRLAPQCLRCASGAVEFDAEEVSELHPAVMQRLLRRAVELVRGGLQGWDAAHVEQLSALAQSTSGSGKLTLPGVAAERSFGTVRLTLFGTDKTAAAERPVLVQSPGRYDLPDGRGMVELDWLAGRPETGGYNNQSDETVDWDRAPKPLYLRRWQPGDHFQPRGAARPRKLKELFQTARIAAWRRRDWPVLVCETEAAGAAEASTATSGGVIWARQFGVAEQFAPRQHSQRLMRIRLLGSNCNESKSPPARLQKVVTDNLDAPASRGPEDH